MEKRYGLPTAICMVVGIVIGSGVFFKAEKVLQATQGNMPLGILAWGIVGAIMIICSYVFATMATRYEKVSGLVDYAEATVGRRYAYYVGWFMAVLYTPCLVSALAWISARYFCVLLGWDITGGACMTIAGAMLCLDPSAFLARDFAKGRAAVLFSATLTPAGYYRDLCGVPDAHAVALRSPFPQGNLGLWCAGQVSTRYKDRQASLEAIARYLHAMAAGRKGNYIAFFPSYSYLAQVHEVFCRLFPEAETLVQEAGMGETAREAFLARFVPGEALLGFGVLGGVFRPQKL